MTSWGVNTSIKVKTGQRRKVICHNINLHIELLHVNRMHIDLFPHPGLSLISNNIPAHDPITLWSGEEGGGTIRQILYPAKVQGEVGVLPLGCRIAVVVVTPNMWWSLQQVKQNKKIRIYVHTAAVPSNPFWSLSRITSPRTYAVCMSVLLNMSIMCLGKP